MNRVEIAEAFRAAVTLHLAGESNSAEDLLEAYQMDIDDVLMFAGLGVAMTGNMVRMLGEIWSAEHGREVTSSEAWELIIRSGQDLKLPGME